MAQLEDLVRPAARLPALLRRQQLVRLSGDGWTQVLEAPWDAGARACLALWAARGLPLVVTRQPPGHEETLALGLPAPARFRRRRLALAVAPSHVMFLDEFPLADAVTRLLPRPLAMPWRALLAAVDWDGPRLDGELLFPDGAAIAWREWQAWRQGRAPQVLVKRLRGVALETPA